MDTRKEIDDLVAFPGRAPGSDAERRAARHLEERFEEIGREAETQPVQVFPNWPLTHALHALAGIAGSVIAVSSPFIGTLIVLVAAMSAFGDIGGSYLAVRRLTGRRASQNVVSGEESDRPGTLVLVANYDAGRTGILHGRRLNERRARIGRLLRRPLGQYEPFFWSLVLVLVCCLARLAGEDSTALTVVQFVPTVILILYVPLFTDAGLSGVVPAANDNAAGVAGVLELAERLDGDLEHFDLWILLAGSGTGLGLGVRAWIREFRRELDRERTVFVELRGPGRGELAYARREGPLVGASYHPLLVELCEELGLPSVSSRDITGAHIARLRSFPALSLSGRDEHGLVPDSNLPSDAPARIDDEALADAIDTCERLVRLIDERVGPRLD